MMKKLLVLMLVLGFAGYASAAIIDVNAELVVDLNGDGLVGESDIVYLTITSTDTLDAYDLDVHVTGPGTLIEVDGGPSALYQPYGEMVPVWATLNRQHPGTSSSGDVDPSSFWLYSGIAGNAIAQASDGLLDGLFAAGDLIWGLAIHCEGLGEVIVDITKGKGNTRTGDSYYLVEEDFGGIVIPQVPEPMTMALLGLGGLFMVRRKKA